MSRRPPRPPPSSRSTPSMSWSPRATSARHRRFSAQDMQWQHVADAGRKPGVHAQDRQAERHRGADRRDRARAVRRRRADPRSQADQGERLGLHGRGAADKGMRAISTEISPETGAGGFILPNDRVDVILSRRDREAEKAGGAESHTSETILTNIRVLAIDQTLEEKNGQKVVIGKTATLELDAAPGRNARAVAPARHAVACAAQPRGCRRHRRFRTTTSAPARRPASTRCASASAP